GEFYEAVNQFPIQIDALGSGFYTLFVQDAFGCSQMIDVTIPDVEELVMDFGEDQEVTLGDSILLRPETNFTPVAWEWSSTQFLSQTDTFITYASPMQTTVYQLTLTDANGCSVTDEITVFVNTTLDVYIPNAFSPNDDGFNDEFYIFADDQVELVESFQIFDRWGNQIFFEGPFAPNDPNHGWDGTKNGQAMSPAVFVYFAKIRLVSGTTTLLKGEVTLLR
ncbi:MAG: gliding motility-associated C-terminal domain-containing protein, partial [Saprospiraceae bacterium]|nr:gliding motility-associated C-terminal domain-containing protein [Saprospiraceae bacterium]